MLRFIVQLPQNGEVVTNYVKPELAGKFPLAQSEFLSTHSDQLFSWGLNQDHGEKGGLDAKSGSMV
jgi:hypothetical protein